MSAAMMKKDARVKCGIFLIVIYTSPDCAMIKIIDLKFYSLRYYFFLELAKNKNIFFNINISSC